MTVLRLFVATEESELVDESERGDGWFSGWGAGDGKRTDVTAESGKDSSFGTMTGSDDDSAIGDDLLGTDDTVGADRDGGSSTGG